MSIIKLISDFDGVWTNQEVEAAYVEHYIIKSIADLTGDNTDIISLLINECRKEMDRMPYEYGWYHNGAIAAYYGEDPLADNYAIFDYIDRFATTTTYSNFKQHLYKVKDAILTKTKMTLAEFSNSCFVKSTAQFKLEGKLKPVSSAGRIVKQLNQKGVEIIVVSNSRAEKIQHLFTKAGHTATNEKSIVRGKLHSRGNAKKFVIDNSHTSLPEFLETTGRYKINLRRGDYHKILTEEKPDYVMGDVFSLDLALPLYLRLHDKQFANLKIIQKVQKHTPKWVKDFLSKDKFKGKAFMIDSIDELPGLLFG
jgi:hypothetical protein